jgi:hypothetical protein
MPRLSTPLIAALLAAAAAPAFADNLVSNGSFENGLTGWTLGGADNGTKKYPPVAITYNSSAGYPTGAFSEPVPVQNALTSSPDAAGVHAAYFVSDFAVAQSLSQILTLEAGIYEVGFSAYAPRNGFNNRNEATFKGIMAGVTLADYAVSSGPAQTWQSFSGVTTLAAGTHTIEFVFSSFGAPAKDVVIDQVYVLLLSNSVSVPAPASMSIFALGLVGLAFAGRRRLT